MVFLGPLRHLLDDTTGNVCETRLVVENVKVPEDVIVVYFYDLEARSLVHSLSLSIALLVRLRLALGAIACST